MEFERTPALLEYDITELMQLPSNALSELCYRRRIEIQQGITQRMIQEQVLCPKRASIDPLRLRYGTELISDRTDLDQDVGSYLLLRTIDTATRYKGTSCNKILLGENKEIELFGHPAAFMKALEQVSSEQMMYVLSLLKRGQLELNNAEYVLKMRWEELAARMGRPLMGLLNLCTAKTKYRDVIRRFSAGTPTPVINGFSRKTDFICSSAALHIVLVSTVVSKLPADYFLMLDYSDCAAINGVPLSGIQKSLLSTYLQADSNTQEAAMQYLLPYLISNEG